MYKHDVNSILAKVQETKNGDIVSITAKERLYVHIPKSYENTPFLSFNERVCVVGIFAIVDENKNYCVSLAPSIVVMEPSTISSIVVNDEEYYCLLFEKDDMLIVDRRVAKESTMIYHTYALFISSGYVPWFLDDEKLALLFTNMSYFTEKKFSAFSSIGELIISAMSRSPLNIDDTYRTYLRGLKPGEKALPPKFIGLRNFAITANSKLNKFMGSHFEEGLTGALTSDSYEPTTLEQVLRQ
jgi:hypothetical protein